MKTCLNGCSRVLYPGTKDQWSWRMAVRYWRASTSASAVRGMSFNILFLDEFAFVPNHVADSFFASVYPTITSGKNTKVIIVSTPHGMNHFYRMWHDAEQGKNEYIPTDVHWSEVPGRDENGNQQLLQTLQNNNLK